MGLNYTKTRQVLPLFSFDNSLKLIAFGLIGSQYIRPGRFYGIISLSIYRIVSKHASQDILNIDSLIHSVATKRFCHIVELAMDHWHATSSQLPIISLVGQIFMLLIKHS